MPIKRIERKRLIVDIGSGNGNFVALLKKQNPKARVIGIDRNSQAKPDVRLSMAEFSAKIKHPDRLNGIWLNHVDTRSTEGVREFESLIKIVPPKTPIFMTIRKENLEIVKTIIKHLARQGIVLKSAIPFNPKTMIGSEYTHKFYQEAQMGEEHKTPYRLVIMKE